MNKNCVIIVDPMSTGALYAPLISKMGYLCYGVLSDPNIPAKFMKSFTGDGLVDHYLYSVEEIKTKLSSEDVFAVICGAETGVYCTDSLANYFGVPGNDIHHTNWRRSKIDMQNRLKLNGLRSIQTVEITQEMNNFPAFSSETGYVLKPNESCGTDDVLFFSDLDSLRKYIKEIDWTRPNAVGQPNKSYLLQERLVGDEYVVDLVASNGVTKICSLCRYRKGTHNNNHFVYEALEILDLSKQEYLPLLSYSVDCTKAVGITYGPAHLELILTSTGPVMVEVGARLHGGVAPVLLDECYSDGLLKTAVSLYADNFDSEPAVLKKSGRIIFLINEEQDRRVANTSRLISNLQSIHGVSTVKLFFGDNDLIPLTTNLIDCPGIVTAVAEDEATLDTIEDKIRTVFTS